MRDRVASPRPDAHMSLGQTQQTRHGKLEASRQNIAAPETAPRSPSPNANSVLPRRVSEVFELAEAMPNYAMFVEVLCCCGAACPVDATCSGGQDTPRPAEKRVKNKLAASRSYWCGPTPALYELLPLAGITPHTTNASSNAGISSGKHSLHSSPLTESAPHS